VQGPQPIGMEHGSIVKLEVEKAAWSCRDRKPLPWWNGMSELCQKDFEPENCQE
jgi:hypothetical protein